MKRLLIASLSSLAGIAGMLIPSVTSAAVTPPPFGQHFLAALKTNEVREIGYRISSLERSASGMALFTSHQGKGTVAGLSVQTTKNQSLISSLNALKTKISADTTMQSLQQDISSLNALVNPKKHK